MYWLKYIKYQAEKSKIKWKTENPKIERKTKNKKDIQGCKKDNFLVTPCA